MKNVKHTPMMTITILMISAVVISCTKTVPYKEVYKEKVHTKSQIDTTTEYLYVPSSDTASNDDLGAARALPYWQGKEKLVKFRFTENALQAVEISHEARLKDNFTNDKVIFEVPISHVEYRCAEDRYKKCTNREEENNEINWSQKHNFIPKFDALKTVGINLLPIEMEKVFGTSCYSESASRFLNYELTEDSLNIQVEKTFTADLNCLEKKNVMVTNLSDAQSTIVYHYSFVKTSTLFSKSYKPVTYPTLDEGTFGFFDTSYATYEVDFNRTEKSKMALMNRWNPERKEIVYYLSDNFNKPELASMKKTTEIAFERVNNGLKEAGTGLRLVLKDAAQKQPGDIRNSMVVLVEDPIAAGPLGYGPVVTNPRTGEIASGRVAMYYGNMLQGIKYTYDEVRRELRYAKANAEKGVQQKTAPAANAPAENALSANLQYQTQLTKHMNAAFSKRIGAKIAKKFQVQSAKGVKSNATYALNKPLAQFSKMTRNQFAKTTLQMNRSFKTDDILAAMSRHCNYPAELFPFDEAVKNGLQDKLGEDLKPWEQLSDKEKQEVIALVGPEIWLPTLIHELGHNLGLRHNFGGSEDKDNFYTKDELAKMSVKHEIPYSSVMDYGYSELNLLPTLGKYDIAALRFGYKREVTTKSGETLKVETTLKDLKLGEDALKEFRYCTDEHVDVNPGCKRFDKGTTLSQIADHMIKQYNDFYSRRNLRNGRESMSQMGDASYAANIRNRFKDLRAFMERYDSLKARFKLADNAPEWTDVGHLKDLKEAALKSGFFFMNVLKTPDLTCVIAQNGKIVQLAPIGIFGGNYTNCFEVALKSEYEMKGQFGKSFNHLKSATSENNYADQIDVRGIYLDKMMAADMLFERSTGNTLYDKEQGNYLDIAELTPEISSTVISILLNQVTVEANIYDQDGNVFLKDEPVPSKMFSTPKSMKSAPATHWIPAPLDKKIADKLELPMQPISFQQVLLQKMEKNMSSSQDHWAEDRAFMDQFRVLKTSSTYQVNVKANALERNLGGLRAVAVPENILAGEIIGLSNVADLLAKLTPEQMKQLIAERTAAQEAQKKGAPVSKDSALPPGYQEIPDQYIEMFAKGILDVDMFDYLLTIFPDVNASRQAPTPQKPVD